jgi:hypothetical protein
MVFDTALARARWGAARGQRNWVLWYTDAVGWNAAPECDDGYAPYLPFDYLVLPSGLALLWDDVPWVWYFSEEDRFRLGSANQAARYRKRRNLRSPVPVEPNDLHGCNVRLDRPDGTFRFVHPASFPAWCGV